MGEKKAKKSDGKPNRRAGGTHVPWTQSKYRFIPRGLARKESRENPRSECGVGGETLRSYFRDQRQNNKYYCPLNLKEKKLLTKKKNLKGGRGGEVKERMARGNIGKKHWEFVGVEVDGN